MKPTLSKFISKRYLAVATVILAGMVTGLWLSGGSLASTPASGSISPTVGATSAPWVGNKLVTGAANGEPSCSSGDANAVNCDLYTLTVTGTKADWAGKLISIKFNWAAPASDYDMVVRKEDNGTFTMQADGLTNNTPPLDSVVGTSGNGTNTFEEVVLSPADLGTGIYYVRAIYFAGGGVADQYNGTATVVSGVGSPPVGTCAAPAFDNYQPPVGFSRRNDAGEPSIGINWNTGAVMTMSRLQANRTTFTDSTSPAHPVTGTSWFARSITLAPTGFDPIGFTDPITGRSIFGELVVVGGSTNSVLSDDDLGTISNVVQTGGATQGVDHQTIGGGPPNPNITGRQPTGSYPHLWYYASQSIAVATVATSFDGGYSYQPAVPAYNLTQCNGLHGHIKVAPDGTVYLPNKGCGGKSGFAVSTDNGLTWAVRTVPFSTAGATDPSVGIGAGGRVYFAYSGANNHPHVAVSDDRGITWRNHFDLASLVAPSSITAAVFMHSVAGDNNRAAVFFLGTTSRDTHDPTGIDGAPATGADPDLTDNFKGTWYPYMATTCDGGNTWRVTRADNDPLRPGNNPVQQGVVCTNGTTCPGGPPDTRNLLDFNEMAVDSRGRIVAVYADGCITDACLNLPEHSAAKEGNDGQATMTIIRQRSGPRLFAAFDPGGPAPPPLAPAVFITEVARGTNIRWATPDDGGSPIISYRVYRGLNGGKEALIAEVKPNRNAFLDRRTFQNSGDVYYKVEAVNALGVSPRNLKFYIAGHAE